MSTVISFAAFILAIIVHEFAHAYVANWRGDATAAEHGRLTLNPLAHIDPVGTILLPLMLAFTRSPVIFGWARPVPVNFSRLRNPRRDMALVGAAGPLANLLLAVVIAQILKATAAGASELGLFILIQLLMTNIFLAVFNLIPIPPLDGSRVAMGLLPVPMARMLARLEPYGMFVLIALLYTGMLRRVIWPAATVIMKVLLGES